MQYLFDYVCCRVTGAHFVVTSGVLAVTGGTVVVSGDLACVGDKCQTKKPPPFLTFDLSESKMCAAGEAPKTTKPKPTKPKTTKPTTKIGDIASHVPCCCCFCDKNLTWPPPTFDTFRLSM